MCICHTHQYLADKMFGMIREAIREHVVQLGDLLKAQVLIAVTIATIRGPSIIMCDAYGAWNGGLPDSS